MLSPNRSAKAATKHHNRVAAMMLHTKWYSSCPTSRLAHDAGVAKSTICKMMHGRANPLYSTTLRVVKCLERDLGLPLDHREVFSEDGSYPTQFVCAVVGCRGCGPPIVYGHGTEVKEALRSLRSGQWTGDTCEFDFISKEERRT